MSLHPEHENCASPVPPADELQVGSSAPNIEIGPNHRRGISATLAYLDEDICQMERMVTSGDTVSELYIERNALTHAQKQAVLSEIATLRALLAKLRQTLRLAPVTRDVAAMISGNCMLLWESIIELQGKFLKRYGDPPQQLVDFLDPKSEELIFHLDRIVKVLGVFRLAGPTPRDDK